MRTQWTTARRLASGTPPARASMIRTPSATWPSSRPSSEMPDLRAVGELARLADVVQQRGGDQHVGVQPRVQDARLQRERPDRDGVLEQPAEVGVVAGARARRAPELGAQLGVGEHGAQPVRAGRCRGPRGSGARGSRRARRGRGRRRAGRRPGRRPPRGRSPCTSSDSSSRKRSTRARTRTRSPRSKRPAEHVGVAERAARDRRLTGRGTPAPGTGEPERAIRRSLRVHARTRSTSWPARRAATEGSLTASIATEPIMYRGSDAAVALGTPTRRAARTGAGRRLRGLERRR